MGTFSLSAVLLLQSQDDGGAVALVLVLIGLYFLPTIIGWKKRNCGAILALNVFLGWTVIGWIVAFVWAVTKDSPPSQVIVNQPTAAPSATPPTSLCAACGKFSIAGGQFCPHCGASLLGGSPSAPAQRPSAN